MDDEALWSDDPQVLRDSEWDKISSDFTNAGYREGITAGKEFALQQGFDDGFAQVGAPIGRELGILRGVCSALLAFLQRAPESTPGDQAFPLLDEVRAVARLLADVRFSDVAPPDLEAIAHAREHLALESDSEIGGGGGADLADPAKLNEETRDRRDMEGLEDLMARMGGAASGGSSMPTRPTADDVGQLKERLMTVARGLGIDLQWY